MTNVVAMIIMLTSPLSIFPFEQCEKFSASMQLRHVSHVGDQQIFIGAI